MYLVGIYNNLVTLRNDLERSFANIDVLLKQRHDELPKLIRNLQGVTCSTNRRRCRPSPRPAPPTPAPTSRRTKRKLIT